MKRPIYKNHFKQSAENNGHLKVLKNIIEAYKISKENNINMIVIFIPSKRFAIEGISSKLTETVYYDKIIKDLEKTGIAFIDLRIVFRKQKNPGSLYWKSDSHWNYNGMVLAAKQVLEKMKK
jgi:hypothetical protein